MRKASVIEWILLATIVFVPLLVGAFILILHAVLVAEGLVEPRANEYADVMLGFVSALIMLGIAIGLFLEFLNTMYVNILETIREKSNQS